jgi:DNA-binding transcriptional regulator GbsR (MarR family)
MKKEIKKEEDFNPEYLLVPRLAMSLPAADRMVFGVVYMFCQLSKKKCTASNVEIGRIACISAGAVANSLNRLEEIGLIKRFYKDNRRKIKHNLSWF